MTDDERKQAIKASFDGKKDADIRAAADKFGVTFRHDDNRDEKLEKLAIKIIADEDAAKEAAERQAREEAERQAKEAAERKAREEGAGRDVNDPVRDRAVRSVHAAFIKDLPRSVRSGGVHAVDPESPEAGDHAVPDGRYRVSGSDYILEFSGGKWAGAVRASPRNEPDYVEIPDSDGASVGAPPPSHPSL